MNADDQKQGQAATRCSGTKRYYPYKAIIPRAFEGAVYMAVALFAVYLAYAQNGGTLLDRRLSVLLLLAAGSYVIVQCWWWLRTYYCVQTNGLLICKAGRRELVAWDAIHSAYYDSAALAVEIVTDDNRSVDLIEYNDLRKLIDELDNRGIRLEYKRFRQ